MPNRCVAALVLSCVALSVGAQVEVLSVEHAMSYSIVSSELEVDVADSIVSSDRPFDDAFGDLFFGPDDEFELNMELRSEVSSYVFDGRGVAELRTDVRNPTIPYEYQAEVVTTVEISFRSLVSELLFVNAGMLASSDDTAATVLIRVRNDTTGQIEYRDSLNTSLPDIFRLVPLQLGDRYTLYMEAKVDIPSEMVSGSSPFRLARSAIFDYTIEFPVGCLPDANGDTVLTPADYNAWILQFNTRGPRCDQNLDDRCTPADFNAWILNFNSGC